MKIALSIPDDLFESAEHLLDAGQPGNRLFVLAIGISQSEVDASLHRLALAHFFEQVVHDWGVAHTSALCFAPGRRISEGPGKFVEEPRAFYMLARHMDAFALPLCPQVAALSSAACAVHGSGRGELSAL